MRSVGTRRGLRRSAGQLAGLLVGALVGAQVGAQVGALVGALVTVLLPGTPTGDPAPPPTAVAALADLAAHGIDPDAPADTDGKCTDEAATWLATGWPGTVHWGLGTAGIPAYLGSTDAVRDVVRRAAGNVDVGHNACGLPENLGASAQFDGDTTRRAAVHPDGSCGRRDGHNVVSFGRLPSGVLALTCLWWEPGRSGGDGRTVEADVLVNDTPGRFALSPPDDCLQRWDLESALTHEFGHVFGLGHVSAARHPGLTMGDTLPPCDVSHRALGLGDLRMLQAHYGTG